MKTIWTIGFTIVATLLSVGLILYLAQVPRGEAVVLRPPPTPQPIQVHVSGGITIPGLYELPVGSRVLDAVEAAGGFLEEAIPDELNLAKPLLDGEHLIIPTAPDEPQLPGAFVTQETTALGGSSYLINLNTATQSELESLPGIGPVLAQEIILYRETNGPFKRIEDILEVKGIGPVKYDNIHEMITVDDTR